MFQKDPASDNPFGALFAIALLAQTPAERGIAGIVVDDQGKPVATARVILPDFDPLGQQGQTDRRRATTDVAGQFRIVLPPSPGGYPGRRLCALRRVGVGCRAHT